VGYIVFSFLSDSFSVFFSTPFVSDNVPPPFLAARRTARHSSSQELVLMAIITLAQFDSPITIGTTIGRIGGI